MSERKKSISKAIIGIMSRAARSVSNEPNALGWPPVCMGILYQPKRPLKNKNDNKNHVIQQKNKLEEHPYD